MWSDKVWGWVDELNTWVPDPDDGVRHAFDGTKFTIKTLEEVKYVENDDIIAETWGLQGPPSGWDSWSDDPEPEVKSPWFVDHDQWTVLMKSNAGYEMRAWPGHGRVILSRTGKNVVVVAAFAEGHGADAQDKWNEIHHLLQPKPKPWVPPKKMKAAAYGPSNSDLVQRLGEHVKDFYAQVKCGACNQRGSLYGIIQHLNDFHQWKREVIADWLETLDLDLTVHQEIVTPTPDPYGFLAKKAEAKKAGKQDAMQAAIEAMMVKPMDPAVVMEMIGIEKIEPLSTPKPNSLPNPLPSGIKLPPDKTVEQAIKEINEAFSPMIDSLKMAFTSLGTSLAAVMNSPEMKALLEFSQEHTEKKEQD